MRQVIQELTEEIHHITSQKMLLATLAVIPPFPIRETKDTNSCLAFSKNIPNRRKITHKNNTQNTYSIALRIELATSDPGSPLRPRPRACLCSRCYLILTSTLGGGDACPRFTEEVLRLPKVKQTGNVRVRTQIQSVPFQSLRSQPLR